MNPLQEKINNDLKKALREKDELLVLVLRGLNSAIHNKEIEKRTKLSKTEKDIEKLKKGSRLTEEEVVEVIFSEAKKRKDAIEEFEKGERQDLIEKEEKELEILKKYLPEQISEEQIKEEVKKVIEEVGAVGLQDTGKIMGALMPKLKGKAEGGVVSRIVSELLKNA
ncbi:MAG: GatB/YqeY domain-containing protein [Candidatus Omnitrophica bacterium]|nr:GatB/YqeY domain-containing protein [Candidatus Omnitrophota bacterium]